MTTADEVIVECYRSFKAQFRSAPEGDLLKWTAEACGVTTARVGSALRESVPPKRYGVIIPPAQKIDPWGD